MVWHCQLCASSPTRRQSCPRDNSTTTISRGHFVSEQWYPVRLSFLLPSWPVDMSTYITLCGACNCGTVVTVCVGINGRDLRVFLVGSRMVLLAMKLSWSAMSIFSLRVIWTPALAVLDGGGACQFAAQSIRRRYARVSSVRHQSARQPVFSVRSRRMAPLGKELLLAPMCRSNVIMVVALCTVSWCGTNTAHAVVCDGIASCQLQREGGSHNVLLAVGHCGRDICICKKHGCLISVVSDAGRPVRWS